MSNKTGGDWIQNPGYFGSQYEEQARELERQGQAQKAEEARRAAEVMRILEQNQRANKRNR
jgi:hypothetical protein